MTMTILLVTDQHCILRMALLAVNTGMGPDSEMDLDALGLSASTIRGLEKAAARLEGDTTVYMAVCQHFDINLFIFYNNNIYYFKVPYSSTLMQ